jgi:LysM domain
MANKLKWTDWGSVDVERISIDAPTSSLRTARAQVAACLLALAGLAVVVPGPASWGSRLSDQASRAAVSSQIGSAVEAAVLVVAGVVVWALLLWVAVVWLAAIAGSLPGPAGRKGRAVLRRIAPAAAGRIVAAAVGVSLLAGTSACAVPSMSAASSAVSSTVQSATESAGQTVSGDATTIPVPSGGGTGMATPTALDESTLPTVSIDWPAPDSQVAPLTHAAPANAPSTRTASTPPTLTPPSEASPIAPTADPTSAPVLSEPDSAAPDQDSVPPQPDTAPEAGGISAPEFDPQSAVPTTESPAIAGGPSALPSSEGPAARVEVRPGDTLWSIARHHLSPDASDAEIDTAWHAWYSANAAVIGTDPDLIQPGQLFTPPTPETGN